MTKKKLNAYKAIFFDAGDTLITIPASHEIMQAYLSERAFPHDSVQLRSILDEAINQFYNHKTGYSNEAVTPASDREFWVKIYRFIMERLGAERYWSDEAIWRCCHELYDAYVAPEYYALFDDVEEVTQELLRRGFRLGVVSNFARTLDAIFARHGIRDRFDPFIVSTEVGLEKPNPAIFRLALDRAGLAASDVLYVGDHETNDLWAPAQVGIDAIRIMRYDHQSGEGIRSLRELLEL